MKLTKLFVSSLLASSLLIAGCNETKNDFYGEDGAPATSFADCDGLVSAEACLDQTVTPAGFGVAVHARLPNGDEIWLADNQNNQASFANIANNIITVGKANGAAALEIEEGALDAAYATGVTHVCEDVGGNYAIIMKNAELNGNFDSKNGTSCYIKIVDNDRASFKASFYGHVSDNGTALEILDGYARVKLPAAPVAGNRTGEEYMDDASIQFGVAALLEIDGQEYWLTEEQTLPDDLIKFVNHYASSHIDIGPRDDYMGRFSLRLEETYVTDTSVHSATCGAANSPAASVKVKYNAGNGLETYMNNVATCLFTILSHGTPGNTNDPFIATFNNATLYAASTNNPITVKQGYIRVVLPSSLSPSSPVLPAGIDNGLARISSGTGPYRFTAKLNGSAPMVIDDANYVSYGRRYGGFHDGFDPLPARNNNLIEISIPTNTLGILRATPGSIPSIQDCTDPSSFHFYINDGDGANTFLPATECTIKITKLTSCELEFVFDAKLLQVGNNTWHLTEGAVIVDNRNNPNNDCPSTTTTTYGVDFDIEGTHYVSSASVFPLTNIKIEGELNEQPDAPQHPTAAGSNVPSDNYVMNTLYTREVSFGGRYSINRDYIEVFNSRQTSELTAKNTSPVTYEANDETHSLNIFINGYAPTQNAYPCTSNGSAYYLDTSIQIRIKEELAVYNETGGYDPSSTTFAKYSFAGTTRDYPAESSCTINISQHPNASNNYTIKGTFEFEAYISGTQNGGYTPTDWKATNGTFEMQLDLDLTP